MGKNNKIILFLLIVGNCTFHSCVDGSYAIHNFYCDRKAAKDVWRLPIVEPYQLITADINNGGWNLSWTSNSKIESIFNFGADSVNYQQNMIILYSNLGIFNLNVIDLKDQKVFRFKNRTEYINFAEKKSITLKLFSVNSVYKDWIASDSLPWKAEISNYSGCH